MDFFNTRTASCLSPSMLLALLGLTACSGEVGAVTFGPGEPLAAGATTTLQSFAPDTTDHVTSSDPAVVAVIGESKTRVAAGTPGTATLTAYDASNAVLARETVTVAATATIGLDFDLDPRGYAIVLGESQALHATTLATDGTILVGDGAIHFAFAGSIASSSVGPDCSGDCAGFETIAPGDAQVVLTAASSPATVTIPLHVVTQIDSFDVERPTLDVKVGDTAIMPISVTAGGLTAWTSVGCQPQDGNKVIVFVGPFLGPSVPPTQVLVYGVQAGSTNVTCRAGTFTQTFAVTVQ